MKINTIALVLPSGNIKEEQKIIINDITEKIKAFNIESYEKEYIYGIGKTFSTIKKLIEQIRFWWYIFKEKYNL